ncbi:MAG: MoaD/ThiS family protein [Candidatus Hadarchaeia archaeon]
MNVKVKIECDLCEKKGGREIKIPIGQEETVDMLLIRLSKRTPEVVESILDPRTGGLRSGYTIKLNGRPVKEIKGMHTKIKERDEVKITT